MAYVSCMVAPPNPNYDDTMLKEGEQRIQCTDENGVVWHLTTNSQVGDWLRFVEEGGTVTPYEDPAEGKPAPRSKKVR